MKLWITTISITLLCIATIADTISKPTAHTLSKINPKTKALSDIQILDRYKQILNWDDDNELMDDYEVYYEDFIEDMNPKAKKLVIEIYNENQSLFESLWDTVKAEVYNAIFYVAASISKPEIYWWIAAKEKLKELEEKWQEMMKNGTLLKNSVDEEMIASIVSRWTGISVSKMLQGEKEKILAIESILREEVVGQDEALKAVARAIKCNKAGLSDTNRPIGSFMFLGPTGVGKTQVAKTLSEVIKILQGIVSTTVHMHERGIMHGDFYAHNIMIDDKANSILGDFVGASYFEPTKVETRHALERLKVRVFGCLME